jgi:hypothetical protein
VIAELLNNLKRHRLGNGRHDGVGRQAQLRRHLSIHYVAMILAASGIAGPIVTLLLRASAFSAAAQLTLRQGILATGAGPTREKMHKAIAPTAIPLTGNARGMWTYEAPYAAVNMSPSTPIASTR